MNFRFAFAGLLCASLFPLGVACLLADMTRRQAMVLAALITATGLAALGCQTKPGSHALSWFIMPPHVFILVITITVASGAAVTASVFVSRRQRRQLVWQIQPPQSEFGEYCIRHLEASGWTRQTLHWGMLMTICRMEKAPRRVTAVFLVLPISPVRLDAMLKSLKWKPYGRLVIVNWKTQIPSYSSAARDNGWNTLSSSTLDWMEAAHDGCS
ncbi:MAG: hypothetical protein ACRYGI_09795 [Janthinobacterium lividum]